MSRRTLLLELDDAVIVDVVSPVLSYKAYREGTHYESTAVPEGARRFVLEDPSGRAREVFVRPAVIDALRRASATGVDIVWNSRWLVTPDALQRLADELGLGEAVRFPADGELAAEPTLDPLRSDVPEFWDDWRTRTIIARVRDLPVGDDLVTADEGIDLSALRIITGISLRADAVDPLLGSIPVRREWGLDEGALRSWSPERARTPTWHR